MNDFLLAAAGFLLVVALIVLLEWRSARSDRKAAGIRAAERGRGK